MSGLVEWSAFLEEALHRPPLVRMNGKAPLDPNWTTGPFDDPEQWRHQLERHTGNVGMVLGRGLLAVDHDSYKAEGEDSFERLCRDTGLPTSTVSAVTGRGGRHYFYAYPEDRLAPSVPLGPRGYPGIEVKGDGGCVVVEPSIHPDTGRPYSFEHSTAPGTTEVAAAPAAFLALLGPIRTGRKETSPLDWEVAELLTEHFGGHSVQAVRDGTLSIWRPGKLQGSAGATIGGIGPGVVHFWSDSWPPFDQGATLNLDELRRLAGLTVVPAFEVAEAMTLPEGYRLWQPGDDVVPPPTLEEAAYHGPVGEYLRLIEGQSEAHPAAVGITLLTELGCLIGRRAVIVIGEHFHHCNLFVLIPGRTSTGAKGVADRTAEVLMGQVEPRFGVRHAIGGFGSGEALIEDVKDPDPDKDEPPAEKRRVVVEAEFARVLQVARREQSILSVIIRNAFDYQPLRHRTKSSGLIVSTDHHLSVIGSITPAELVDLSSSLDLKNGWLNRFCFCHSELSDILPFGGTLDPEATRGIAGRLTTALDRLEEGLIPPRIYRLKAGTEVGEYWAPWYYGIREGTEPLADLTCRQHVHVARLMLILAVLDQADELTAKHFLAAKAWSDYSVATAMRIFGGSAPGVTGRALQLLSAIRDAGPDGLDGTAQRDLFHRNLTGEELEALRADLEDRNLIYSYKRATGGRPVMISVAIHPVYEGTTKRPNRPKPPLGHFSRLVVPPYRGQK
jgi:hypothetical protein